MKSCRRWRDHRSGIGNAAVGLTIGFFIALGKQSEEPTIRAAANIYTTIFRGLPELLTLFIVFYGAQIGIQAAYAAITDPRLSLR